MIRPSHASITVAVLTRRFDAWLQVFTTPRVGVLSTGDELVEPHTEALGPGKIRDANRAMLIAAAQAAGAEVLDFGIAIDTEEAVEGAFAAILKQRVDVLLTSGTPCLAPLPTAAEAPAPVH